MERKTGLRLCELRRTEPTGRSGRIPPMHRPLVHHFKQYWCHGRKAIGPDADIPVAADYDSAGKPISLYGGRLTASGASFPSAIWTRPSRLHSDSGDIPLPQDFEWLRQSQPDTLSRENLMSCRGMFRTNGLSTRKPDGFPGSVGDLERYRAELANVALVAFHLGHNLVIAVRYPGHIHHHRPTGIARLGKNLDDVFPFDVRSRVLQ
jgi:hypothetical protein